MKRQRPFPRDQEPTPFAAILEQLCADSGSHAAALVDAEGETVDYAGHGDPFEIRILAAELRLLLQNAGASERLGGASELTVRARRRSFLVVALADGYALAIELPRRASDISRRALGAALRAICAEAGFRFERPASTWLPVPVLEEPGSIRPLSITVNGASEDLVVLGRLVGLSPTSREQGFRVRFGTGREGNLVREALGHWFIEEEQ